jgi:uncharacterized protein YbaP (TraB family)
MFLPDDKTLEDVLPEDIFENFYRNLRTFRHVGITYDMVKNLTPAAVMFELSWLVTENHGAVQRRLSVDDFVESVAVADSRPTIGLTTVLNQSENVFDIPLEIQAYALAGFPTFWEWAGSYDEFDLIDAYANQDIEAIRAMNMVYTSDYYEINPFTEMLNYRHLYVRNYHFANEIERLLRETEEPTTFFVTVGMWHIIGGEGGGRIIYHMENAGFDVTPLWKELEASQPYEA